MVCSLKSILVAQFRGRRIQDQFLKYQGHEDVRCEDLGSHRDCCFHVRVLFPIVLVEELMLGVEQAKVQVVKEVPVVDLRHNPRLKPTFLTTDYHSVFLS